MAPIQLSLILFGLETLKTFDVKQGIQNVENKFWIGYQASLRFWPLANFLVYHVPPPHMRAPLNDVFNFI